MSSPSANNKRIAKNTFYLYIRLIVSLFVGLYVSRVVLDALGIKDYGIYNIVGGFVSMLAIFTGSITSAANRFITFELGRGDTEVLKKTFSTIVTLLVLMAMTVFVAGEFIGMFFIDRILVIPPDRMEAAYFVFHLSLLAFGINLVSVPYMAAVTAHEKMNFFALVSIFESVAKLVIVYLLYLSPFDRLKSYAVLLVVVGVIIRIVYGIYCNRHFPETHFSFQIDRGVFKNIFSYSFWVTIGASSGILKEQGVNVIINMFYGVVMNASRGISMQVSGAINQFSNNIATAIQPQITKSYAVGDLNRSIDLTLILMKAQGIMLLLMSLPLFLEMDYVLKLWLGDVPYYAVTFARWSLILCYVRTLENAHGALYLATGKVRNLQIVGGGLMLLTLPFSYFFLKWGYEPVTTMMIGTVLEVITMFVAFGYLRQIVGFPLRRLFREALLPLVLTILLSLVPPLTVKYQIPEEGFDRFVVVTLASVLSTALFSYLILLNKKEKSFIVVTIKNKLINKIHR